MEKTSVNKQLKLKKLKIGLKTIFMANSGGFSSKRIFGALAFSVCIGVFITAFITLREVPQYGDLILITATSLLGIDSVKEIFTKK